MPTLSNEQRVAIAVGVPVAVVLLYFLFRRLRRDEFDDDDEDDLEAETVDEVEEVASTSESTIEVKVPRSAVGAVIGKGGVNIKRIQKESGARLNFKDDEDEESPERTAIVRGEREKAKKAELLIKQVIAQQPVITTEEVYVPKEACGRIIGRGGQSIRQMCRISGARLTVERSSELDTQSPLRKVTLTGTAEQILHGKGLLEEKVTEEASFAARKGATYKSRSSSIPDYQQEKVPVTVQDTAMKLPDGSDFVRVFVSALDDPTSFHVQLIAENADSLEAMNAELTAEFFHSADASVMNGFKTGNMCCAPFDVDNCWYRARITNISSDNTVDVLYVDFGDRGQVHKSRLRVLKNRYRGLPHQAVHCSLANYRPTDDEWSEEAIEAFEEMTYCAQWQVLMARVMRYCGDVACVELVDTNSPSQDVNIGKELEKKQFAVADSSYPTEAVLKERLVNLELNHRLTNATEQKDEVTGRDERNELEHKRSLSFQDYDFKAAKKPRADDASQATETNKSSTENLLKPGEDNKFPAEEKASLESLKNRMDKLTLNENTTQVLATGEASNVITEEKLKSESVDNLNSELEPDQNTVQAQISNRVWNAEDTPISQVVENHTAELTPNGLGADTAPSGDSRTEKEQMAQTPDPRTASEQDVVDTGSNRHEEISPYHEPISPNNESSRLHYAKIKRNLSISTEDDAHKGGSNVSDQLESLREEKVQLGMEAAVDAEPKQSAFLGVVSSAHSIDPDFKGKEVPNLKTVIVNNQSVDIPREEKEGIELSEKQARIKSISPVFTSSTHHTVSSQKTYVSSVSVVTKKKTNDVSVRLSSSAGEQTEAEGIGGLVVKTPTSTTLTAAEAKRASTELVVNVSSSGPLESVPVSETLTPNSDKVETTAHTGNHGNGHESDPSIRSELNGYSSQTVTLETKRVTQLKHVTMVTTANADADAGSADDSDSESFLSAREEVTSDTDTAAYLTARASGSTTSLDYQSLDTDTDTAHTPVNSDSEDERGGPTTPKPSLVRVGSDEDDTADEPTGSLSSKEIAEGISLFNSVSETELGYRADTESLTSREDLRQAGTS